MMSVVALTPYSCVVIFPATLTCLSLGCLSYLVLSYHQSVVVKNLPAMRETWARSLGCEDPPGEGNGYALQYFGLENFMNCIYSPWSCKESDTNFTFSL